MFTLFSTLGCLENRVVKLLLRLALCYLVAQAPVQPIQISLVLWVTFYHIAHEIFGYCFGVFFLCAVIKVCNCPRVIKKFERSHVPLVETFFASTPFSPHPLLMVANEAAKRQNCPPLSVMTHALTTTTLFGLLLQLTALNSGMP